MAEPKPIYLGIKGTVIALDADTGTQLWATHLEGSDFVNVVLDGDQLYGATHGEVFCLDPKTGAHRWHNPLKGFGWGLVTIATENSAENALLTVLAEKRRQEQQASAAASTHAGS